MYSETFVQRPPLGVKKVAVVQKLFRGWTLIVLYTNNIYSSLAVVDRWLLFGGGH
jgi:hypothetical protein